MWHDRITTALDITAASLITYGAVLIYRPAGFIVGGLLVAGLSWIAARADDGPREVPE